MTKAVQWLVSKRTVFNDKILIVGAIASLMTIGCTEKPSPYSQQNLNQNPSPSPIRVSRRTRERQGTAYESLDSSFGNQENLPNLKIGLMPTQNQTEQEQTLKNLDKYLETYLGREVDFQIAKNNKEVIEWLVENKIDIAYLGSVTYVEALEKGAKIQPIVAPIDINTGQPWYRVCIIVKADSNIKTLSDLTGKSIAFVDQISTFGYIVPLQDLKQQRIDKPFRDFTQLIYVGNHSQSMTALENGMVDAVATNLAVYTQQQKSGKITPKNTRIIWESAPIPNFPIVVSEALPPELIQKLRQAFISMPDDIEDIGGGKSAGYSLVIPADYDPIQQLRQKLNLISFLNK